MHRKNEKNSFHAKTALLCISTLPCQALAPV